MPVNPSPPLVFRPAFADESERCFFIDGQKPWNFPDSRWYVVMQETPVERIVATIRYWIGWPAGPALPAFIEFRLSIGPGGEACGHLESIVRNFLSFVDPHGTARVRCQDHLHKDSPFENPLIQNGFKPIYHQYYLRVGYTKMVKRISRVIDTLSRRKNPWNEARIVPARLCKLEHAEPLISRFNLMSEDELRKIWNSPDATRLDREASACLFFDDKPVGVILAVDGGKELRIPAIAVDERIPGARQYGNAVLMNHTILTREHAGYDSFVFRANPETARQTLNMALRVGGEITGEAWRWERAPGTEADRVNE